MVVFVVGLVLAGVGFLLFAGILFASGGTRKSEQLRVTAQVFEGRHGPARRALMFLSIGLLLTGVPLVFFGVALNDRARAERCRSRCAREGYAHADIGPSDESQPGRPGSALYVACTCSRDDGTRVQHPADE